MVADDGSGRTFTKLGQLDGRRYTCRMRPLVLLALLGACTEEPGTTFPLTPGGGSTGGSTMGSGMTADGGTGGAQISGRVCVLLDARNTNACMSSGAGGLTVSIDGRSAATAADGTFVIERPATAGARWSVIGPGVEPTNMRYAADTNTIPVIQSLVYDDMLASSNASRVQGSGAIHARIRQGGAALSNAIVTASPTPDSLVYYDGAVSAVWELDATGPFATVWIPSMPIATATLTIVPQNGTPATIDGLALAADTVTFVAAEIP
jgi:hypothetical protein